MVEGEVALGGTSPARMAAVLRERAAACEEQAKAKRGDMFGGGTASGAAPGAKASADMAWLVPSEDPEANDKRVIDAIGGTAVVVYVCEGVARAQAAGGRAPHAGHGGPLRGGPRLAAQGGRLEPQVDG